MAVTIEKAELAKKWFVSNYYDPKYVNACGISRVGTCDSNAPKDERDDYCVSVRLRKALPRNMAFPPKLLGVRLYSKVIGEIKKQ